MSIYANGLQIQMNEIALLQFIENNQNFNGPVASIAIQYEVLRQMNKAITDCLEQYDVKMHQVQRDKVKAN